MINLKYIIIFYITVNAVEYNITLTHDGPVVLGGTITFKADIFENNDRPSGTFKYKWSDNALNPHIYEVSFFFPVVYILLKLYSFYFIIIIF